MKLLLVGLDIQTLAEFKKKKREIERKKKRKHKNDSPQCIYLV